MLKAILKTMRPRQWTKNIFVIAALVFDRQLFGAIDPVLRSIGGMLLFCLLSSSVYIINDIKDVEADRQHPVKRNRPIASGELSVPVAVGAVVVLLGVTFPLTFLLSPEFFLISLFYFVINLAYSLYLKNVLIVDVLIIAAGFVLRVAAGVTLIQVERFSPWLYVVTTLGALYIGFGKRRAELNLLQNGANNHRKVLDGYTLPFLDQMITIVSSTTIIAYSLYTFSAPNLPSNHAMMLTIPFVMYGVFRYLWLIQVKKEGGAPEEILLKDRPFQIDILLWGISVLVIFYLLAK
ncbi:4-hydroxybenzoate polyprenyltransferase [Longilinea arvoryzae]|uniref:4-hydroxybenzoate polyprenyltransferase n=1 Tax=Longilinea arvoryzae TaxID=360412 RepID=A0A0S7BFV8_9CHLR|nr:decaprenyl-phosphate phosphoribosyltransferase [Longilinea arvoryzae]GAP14409.1 4-hydroxybenzoate polyprenyltransferase [Longilinea arvoryzae]